MRHAAGLRRVDRDPHYIGGAFGIWWSDLGQMPEVVTIVDAEDRVIEDWERVRGAYLRVGDQVLSANVGEHGEGGIYSRQGARLFVYRDDEAATRERAKTAEWDARTTGLNDR